MANEFARDILRVINFTEEKHAEPRVVAIIMAAYVEHYLTDLLKEKLPGLNSVIAARMFKPGEGALGGLSRKIDMARALEILSAHEMREAILIARIRNRFAHKLEVDSFDHPEVVELVEKLTPTHKATIRNEKGEHIDLDIKKTRFTRFRSAGLALCFGIMQGHIKEHPFVYAEPQPSSGKPGDRPPLHELQVLAPPRRPKDPNPAD